MFPRHRRTSHVSLMLQSSSFSSITDSTMSLNIITVTLNMGEWEVCMEPAVLPERDWVVEGAKKTQNGRVFLCIPGYHSGIGVQMTITNTWFV